MQGCVNIVIIPLQCFIMIDELWGRDGVCMVPWCNVSLGAAGEETVDIPVFGLCGGTGLRMGPFRLSFSPFLSVLLNSRWWVHTFTYLLGWWNHTFFCRKEEMGQNLQDTDGKLIWDSVFFFFLDVRGLVRQKENKPQSDNLCLPGEITPSTITLCNRSWGLLFIQTGKKAVSFHCGHDRLICIL